MRKILLTVLTGTALSLAGISALSAAPISGAAVGNATKAVDTLTQVYYRRWRGHARSSYECIPRRLCNEYGCHWRC
jgi:hypothetical protein